VYALATVNSFMLSKTSVVSVSRSNDSENVSNVRHRKDMGHCPFKAWGRRVTRLIRGYGTYARASEWCVRYGRDWTRPHLRLGNIGIREDEMMSGEMESSR
jgi:hypothetical protein